LRYQRELKKVRRRFLQGEFDLYYCDEAGFSLTPSVPYAWQPIGQRLEINSSRSPQLNVLGFLRHDGEHFDPYVLQGTFDSSATIACMDCFCQKLRKPTTVVIDNSPLHTSNAFQSRIPNWESRGLYFWFLPAYSPELNLIEILWKKIKYQWLCRDAYESLANLDEALCEILAGIGSQYTIAFHE
jgi:hypothetical protein